VIEIDGEKFESQNLNEVIEWLDKGGKFVKSWKTDTPALHAEAVQHLLIKYGNCPKDSFIGTKHMFQTMKHFSKLPGVKELKDCYDGVPCVIALTGPSLTKQIPHLKKIWQNVCLIAPDVSLSILESHGIYPHYACAVERGEETTECMKGYHSRTSAVIAPVVPPSFYREYGGEIIIAYRAFDHLKWLPFDKGWLNSTGIVGNMCFHLAEYMGCSEIIIIGGDHAFNEKQTHADGMQFGEEQAPARQGLCKVAGYYGEEVLSSYIYKYAKECLEGQIANSKAKVFNSTEGGALIEGAWHKEFNTFNFSIPFQKKELSDYKAENIKWYKFISQNLESLQQLIDKAELVSQGKGRLGDILLVNPKLFQVLVAHVAQSYMIIQQMEPNGEKFVAMMLRDTMRRIRDELELVR
jgi:hypothetical protein